MSPRRFLTLAIAAVLCRDTVAELRSRDADCSCGYQDSETGRLFTEAIIVYFNESSGVLQDFGSEVYTNHYEKSWNSIYRQGADASNVRLNNTSSSLELSISPPEPNHIVFGGGIRTLRSDIQYGSFRSLFRPSGPYNGGSSISMALTYNESQSIHMNVMNTDAPATAWTSTLIGEEFPDRALGANFSVPGQSSTTSISPWDYTEYRVDWAEKDIKWYIGNTLARTASSHNSTLPSVPCPLFLKHWSTGNLYAEQGPPPKGAIANVGYTRLFFNSSLMTTQGHKAYDSRCQSTPTCSTEDWTLRGSTPCTAEATKKWKQESPRTTVQWIAIWMAVLCIMCSILLLVHTLLPRILAKFSAKKQDGLEQDHEDDNENDLATRHPSRISAYGGPYLEPEDLKHDPAKVLHQMRSVGQIQSGSETTISFTSGTTVFIRPNTNHSLSLSVTDRKLAFWQQGGSARSVVSLKRESGDGSLPTTPRDSRGRTSNASPMPGTPVPGTPIDSRATTMVNLPLDKIMAEEGVGYHTRLASIESVRSNDNTKEKGKSRRVSILLAQEKPPSVTSDNKEPEPLKAKPRVEYLAGLTAMCAIIVSVDHFCSTFVPAVIFPGAPHHYISEKWANKIVTPYLMNQIWIGVFFTCSTRFLVSRYLKSGELDWIAQKAVTRNFRVMIPIVAVAMLEYFLMECGATTWLEYLPSITWSTWPYTIPYNTFGDFLSEVLEIIYLVPNAAPQIIFNYCTGVLWTMPIQLQGSWTVLLGVVVIREIKNPYKRFGYYTMAILFSWYASSWGTYFWLGLLLTDLDIVFKYRKHVSARPWLFYVLTITYGIITILSLSVDTINQVADYSFVDAEHSIHPDQWTGLPIYKANPLEVSDYFIPRLNGLTFAFSLQSLIELSPFFRNVFACKPLRMIFPHIFTIYLFHGLIFWSLGAMICIFLSSHGFAYGLNLFTTAVCCYGALIVSLPIVTPIVELLGKHWTASIWESAHETPPPKRDTLFPFTKELLSEERDVIFDSSNGNDIGGENADEKQSRSDLYPSEKQLQSEGREARRKSQITETIAEITAENKDGNDKSALDLYAVPSDKSSSKKRDSDRSSKGLEYLRELEKRQSQKSGTSSTYSQALSSRESKRESQRSGLSIHTTPLSPFPETPLPQPPQSSFQVSHLAEDSDLDIKKNPIGESTQSSVHVAELLSYPDPVRPRASTRSSLGFVSGHTEQAGLFAQAKRRESSRSSAQQMPEVVNEMILHNKLSIREVRELALQQARESKERKREVEKLGELLREKAASLSEKESDKEEEEEIVVEKLKGKGKGKEKERDVHGLSQGYSNVYGLDSVTASASTVRLSSVSAKEVSAPEKMESSRRSGKTTETESQSFMVEVTDLEHEHQSI